MELHLTPDLEAKLNQLSAETGRAKEELVQDAMAGYLAELSKLRSTLDTRYDDIKSGRTKPSTARMFSATKRFCCLRLLPRLQVLMKNQRI